MTENKEIMAKNIKKNMTKMGVNATEVCKVLGIKQNTFSDWCNAKTYPRIDKIEMMARYFGISKADLVEAERDYTVLTDEEEIIINIIRKDRSLKDHLLKYAEMLNDENAKWQKEKEDEN